MLKLIGGLMGPAVLFSGLFYVAASRLNSPRFQFRFIRRWQEYCQALVRAQRLPENT